MAFTMTSQILTEIERPEDVAVVRLSAQLRVKGVEPSSQQSAPGFAGVQVHLQQGEGDQRRQQRSGGEASKENGQRGVQRDARSRTSILNRSRFERAAAANTSGLVRKVRPSASPAPAMGRTCLRLR